MDVKSMRLKKLWGLAQSVFERLRNLESNTSLNRYPAKLAEFKNLMVNSKKALPDHDTYFNELLKQIVIGIKVIDARYAILFVQQAITLDLDEQIGKNQRSNNIATSISLMKSADFLGLDVNWSLATCALQLQEVAVILVAKDMKVKLDKTNIEKMLSKKIQGLSFNHQYEAFSKYIENSLNIEMPILTTVLRKMRVKVLHEGYNPKPEEREAITSYTIKLLKKLERIKKTNIGNVEKL